MSRELGELTLLVWLTKHNCSRKLEEVLSDIVAVIKKYILKKY